MNELTRLSVDLQAFADRDLDWNDIREIIVRQGTDNLDWNHIFEHLTPLCEAMEAPGIMTRLRKLRW